MKKLNFFFFLKIFGWMGRGYIVDIVIWERFCQKFVLYTTSKYCMKLFFFMMAGDKNSKDSGTDINKKRTSFKFFFFSI